jgi:hypothetical protein
MTSQLWHPDPQLCGLWRLHRDGRATPATALMDRSAGRDEQLAELAGNDWAPLNALSPLFDAVSGRGLPEPTIAGVAPGRVHSPFLWRLPLVIDVAEPVSRHPIVTYLWPQLHDGPNAQIALEDNESVLGRWLAADVRTIGSLIPPGSSKPLVTVTGVSSSRPSTRRSHRHRETVPWPSPSPHRLCTACAGATASSVGRAST